MNENQLPPPPQLTRSSDDRMIGGVAGGLGRILAIDPTLLRLAFVVLTVLGGSGLVIYALAWMIIPGDGAARDRTDDALGDRTGSAPSEPPSAPTRDTDTSPSTAVALYTPV